MPILFPNELLYTGTYFRVEQDWEVPIPGFFIIASLDKQYRAIDQFSAEQLKEFTMLLQTTRQGMRDALHIQEVYLFQNEDSVHGFHMWMFPRHVWMESFGNRIQSVRQIMLWAQENKVDDASLEEVKKYVRLMQARRQLRADSGQ